MRNLCLPLKLFGGFTGMTLLIEPTPVVQLNVHLENHYTIYFGEGEEEQAAAQRRAGEKLTEWLQANKKVQTPATSTI